MQQGIYQQHWTDESGMPAGGCSGGKGFVISWQNGPIGRGPDRVEPNGAFVEDVIVAVIKRIEFYQKSRFNCRDNDRAIKHLKLALLQLEERTKNREARNVEGTHEL